jgi:uncharacterized membrane protein YfcA
MITEPPVSRRRSALSFVTGAAVGILGGLIGLGGAEVRLPLLLTVFGYATLAAVVVNLAVSLVTVVFSFIFRLNTIGLSVVAANISVILNILAGSLIGSYFGARLATYIDERSLRRMVVVLLLMLSLLLMSHEIIADFGTAQLGSPLRVMLGFLSGVAIGVISSRLELQVGN